MKKNIRLQMISIVLMLTLIQTAMHGAHFATEHKGDTLIIKQLITAVKGGDTEKIKKIHAQDGR